MPKKFLSAQWRNLVMLNYDIDPAALRPLVPQGTELDEFEGRTMASVVGFQFRRTRVLGLPIPFHSNFDEVNLRFYIRRKGPDGWRRSVCFVKEVVPRRAIAWVARWLYNENYVRCPMVSQIEPPTPLNATGYLEYAWGPREHRMSVSARFTGEPVLPVPGSEEEFITEHYWGYTSQRRGGTMEYRVEHEPWRVWCASEAKLVCDVATFYGPQFADALNGKPTSAFVAEGSDVSVSKGRLIA